MVKIHCLDKCVDSVLVGRKTISSLYFGANFALMYKNSCGKFVYLSSAKEAFAFNSKRALAK